MKEFTSFRMSLIIFIVFVLPDPTGGFQVSFRVMTGLYEEGGNVFLESCIFFLLERGERRRAYQGCIAEVIWDTKTEKVVFYAWDGHA